MSRLVEPPTALPAIQTGPRATDAAAPETPEPPASAPAPRGDYLSAAAQGKTEVRRPCHPYEPCRPNEGRLRMQHRMGESSKAPNVQTAQVSERRISRSFRTAAALTHAGSRFAGCGGWEW